MNSLLHILNIWVYCNHRLSKWITLFKQNNFTYKTLVTSTCDNPVMLLNTVVSYNKINEYSLIQTKIWVVKISISNEHVLNVAS